jgi:hypothetical protein
MESRGLTNDEIDAVERRADLRAMAVCYFERSEAQRNAAENGAAWEAAT